ncbi:MAG TPA: alkaline phosphatase D family protein, partial [Nevskiaceae bacterium]|nr:alkaline phosphatase D family protein [Nevskiaceae bacterium]
LPLEPYGANYNPSTGAGSLAVELVGTSVTSPGFDDLNGYSADGLQSVNPHLKYVELTQRGYLLLDINSQRVSGEWWYVNTIDTRDDTQSFATALQTSDQANHLEPGAQSPPKPHAPPLAPA